MNKIEMKDFTGGLLEVTAPEDFADNQVAVMKGFVPINELELRSQGPFQKVGNRTDCVGLVVLRGRSHKYLIMLTQLGEVYWMVAPDRNADYLTTRATTWTLLPEVFVTNDNRITGEIRWKVGTEYERAFCVNAISNTEGGSIIYESAPGIVSAIRVPDIWPRRAGDPLEPVAGVLPQHNVSAMWKDFALYADIRWSPEALSGGGTAMTSAKTRRYSNFAWVGDPTNPSKIDPRYPVRLAEEGSVVVGMQEIEEGLLVMTTSSTGSGGLTLLRGRPGFKSDGTPTFETVIIRPGVGMHLNIENFMRAPQHTYWGAIGATVFMDGQAKVQHARGTEVDRLDRYGPAAPDYPSGYDHVASMGDYLFMFRMRRLYVMRSFGKSGSWCELSYPWSGFAPVRSMVPADNCMYMIMDGQVWRYCLEGPTADAERGRVDGVFVDLTLGTRTITGGDPNRESFWDTVTVRAVGTGPSAHLNTVLTTAGGLLLHPTLLAASTSPAQRDHTWGGAYETKVVGGAIQGRQTITVNCHGDSAECAALFTFTGDIRIENITFHFSPGEELW